MKRFILAFMKSLTVRRRFGMVPNLSQIQTFVIGSFIPAFVARLRLPSGGGLAGLWGQG